MFCSNCGTRNEEGTSYCVNCGAELRKIQTPSVEVPPLDTRGAGLSAAPTAGPGASVPNIPNYLVQAVLLTLVCFILSPFTLFFPFLGVITGIVAIVYGAQVNGKVAGGNYVEARDSSRLARVWTWITFAFVVIELFILAAFFLLFILAVLAGASA
ncbi:MAG: hypothetical protein AVDCRST_MAG05-2210 [uncultured Rubrobacteraceae bacterium]|uniref:Zinc-ribbon domain-containing protein n=1 Tax=uncultured Rubrobacteraceae bacterium TaxID=349277 RepID=A0A6J4SF42_9ACTN|nr:MAG: hypothetical protein AVDCRST_MAG05-2210 [uncultured Rubrobacteraceae bacterium]